jgi:hypothetical protein
VESVRVPMLAIAKERPADQIGSAATKGEGRQNMLCAYLAGALLVGLLGNANSRCLVARSGGRAASTERACWSKGNVCGSSTAAARSSSWTSIPGDA